MSSSTAQQILRDTFGYTSFRGAQQAIVEHVVGGGDALVLMPTGGGKSLCYQIPALLRNGVGIVVSPLIALMQDQVDALKQLGVPAAFLNSSLEAEEAREVSRQLMRGELKLLYVAPERLMTEGFLNLLERLQQDDSIALFAIDEAHCVSQWGHDFRPEYRALTVLHERFPGVPRIALTATADAPTRREIVERLSLEQAQQFVSSFDRPNIRYRVTQKNNARQQLQTFLETEHPDDAGIVYCLSRKKVEETAAWLKEQGWDALPYHAGLDAATRSKNQKRFPARGRRDHGRHRRIRHGHRQAQRALRRPSRSAQKHGRLLSGNRPRRPRRPACECLDGLRSGRCCIHAPDAAFRRCARRAQARRIAKAGCAARFLRIHRLPPPDRPALFWRRTSRRLRRMRQLPVARRYLGCHAKPRRWRCPASTAPGSALASCILSTCCWASSTPKVEQFNHQQLTTFGIGKELAQAQWSSVYRQLVAAGFINVDIEGYGGLKLTEAARPVLKGEQEVWLRRDAEPAKRKTSKAERGSRLREAFAGANEDPLWLALKAKRTELAREQGVPPYVIFHDSTLLEILNRKPQTLDEMGQISGVGQAKLAKYGDAFLQVVEDEANRI